MSVFMEPATRNTTAAIRTISCTPGPTALANGESRSGMFLCISITIITAWPLPMPNGSENSRNLLKPAIVEIEEEVPNQSPRRDTMHDRYNATETRTDNEKEISLLNDLIETCRDGAEGFRQAQKDTKDSDLQTLFA